MYGINGATADYSDIASIALFSGEPPDLWQTLIEACTSTVLRAACRLFLDANLAIRAREIGINNHMRRLWLLPRRSR
jgi:hypothetical protein